MVLGFDGALGDFTFDVRPVLELHATTDLNVLVFDANGTARERRAATTTALTGRRPRSPASRARAACSSSSRRRSTDAGAATQLRYVLFNGAQIDEYVQPLAPGIFGHPLARGATAVAAYDPFRPILPENFTSVGGDLPILFDSSGNRLPQPDVRRAPQIAAADGGNTTFFVAGLHAGRRHPAELLRDERRRAARRRHRRARAAGERRAGLDDARCDALAAGGQHVPPRPGSLPRGASGGGLTVTADGTPGAGAPRPAAPSRPPRAR